MFPMIALGVFFLFGVLLLSAVGASARRRTGRVPVILRAGFWGWTLFVAWSAWSYHQSCQPESVLKNMLGVVIEDGVYELRGNVIETADYRATLDFRTSAEVSRRIVENLGYDWKGGDYSYRKNERDEVGSIMERLELSESGTRVSYVYVAY